MSNLLYSWNFNSKKQRWTLWYIITISIAIWLIIWGFLSKQYWMSFVIIILSGLVFYVENNSEDIIWVQIKNDWIKIENIFYPFINIKNYWIIYEGENAIILRINISKKMWIRVIDINIDNTIVSDITSILSTFIESTNKSELTFLEKIIRLLKL